MASICCSQPLCMTVTSRRGNVFVRLTPIPPGRSLWPCYQRTWHHMGKGVLHGTCPSIRTLAPLWSNSVRAYTAPGRGRGVTGRWGPQPGCVLLQKQHWICCISHAYFCRQAAPGIEALRPTHNRSLRLRRLSCTAAAEAAAWVLYVR